eukprot:4693710-Pleurochrysis_carterae.AAC.3
MCKAALQAQPVSATQVVFQELLLQLRALANLSGKKDKAKLGEAGNLTRASEGGVCMGEVNRFGDLVLLRRKHRNA